MLLVHLNKYWNKYYIVKSDWDLGSVIVSFNSEKYCSKDY